MTTLLRRATPAQLRLYRAVHGACQDAAQAHPDWNFDTRLASSIAKRATGTISALGWDRLATPRGASTGVGASRPKPGTSGDAHSHGIPRSGRGRSSARSREPAAVSCSKAAAAFRKLSALVDEARRAGRTERAEALIEALRILDDKP
jgi:hypothetical protein